MKYNIVKIKEFIITCSGTIKSSSTLKLMKRVWIKKKNKNLKPKKLHFKLELVLKERNQILKIKNKTKKRKKRRNQILCTCQNFNQMILTLRSQL